MVQKSLTQDRAHDVTLFIQDNQGRYALTTRHSTPPGVLRSPAVGSHEDRFEDQAKYEALDETGLDIDLKRFVMHVTLDITHENDLFRWDSYVFTAEPQGERHTYSGRKELKTATWAVDSQIEEMSRRLKETGNGGLIYRARLSDAFLWSNSHPLALREAKEKDREKIEASPAMKDPRVEDAKGYLWWSAEVHGLYAGSIGLRPHGNFVELVGLNVHPMFRGRGIGHALVDYAIDRFRQTSFQKLLAPETQLALDGGAWLISNTPGYFMPSGFHLLKPEQTPTELTAYMKNSNAPNLTAMRHPL